MALRRCADCGLVFMDPMPDAATLKALYADGYEGTTRVYLTKVASKMRRSRRRARWLSRRAPGRRFLDVGCNGGFMAEVTAVQAGLIYQDDRLRVYALKADHGDLEAFSYKFVAPDKTIVVSGDTKPVSGLSDWARACAILAHEVYSSAQLAGRPPAWRAYHSRAHTSTAELADLAKEIRPGLLVLYHQLFWGTTAADLLGEIGASYDGAAVSANDLDVF